MKFEITYVEFDFDGDDEISDDEKIDITDEVIGTIWDADDEDDVVEQVTTATGWCIKSIDIDCKSIIIDYRHVKDD
jgi:hypothetical protein